jgi:hypothetical protein
VDPLKRLPGRGLHLCPEAACVAKAVGRKAFNRALRRRVAEADVDRLVGTVAQELDGTVRRLLRDALRDGRARPAGATRTRDVLEEAEVLDPELSEVLRTLTEQKRRLASAGREVGKPGTES